MSEGIPTNDLIDQELDKVTTGDNWHLKQTLIDSGIYASVLDQVCDIPYDQLTQPTTVYSRIAAKDVETVRGVVGKVVQEAFANLQ